jgi:TRAP-type C4-dicarboxylate transport system permease small subunit
MPNARARRIELLVGAVRWLEDALLVALLGSLTLVASAQILLRNLFDAGFIWGDPLLRVLVLWVGLLGAMVASRDDNHISVDVLSEVLPSRAQSAARAFTSLCSAGISSLVAYHAARFVLMDFEAGVSAFARLPAWPFESILPFAFGVIALRSLIHFSVHTRMLLSGEPSP